MAFTSDDFRGPGPKPGAETPWSVCIRSSTKRAHSPCWSVSPGSPSHLRLDDSLGGFTGLRTAAAYCPPRTQTCVCEGRSHSRPHPGETRHTRPGTPPCGGARCHLNSQQQCVRRAQSPDQRGSPRLAGQGFHWGSPQGLQPPVTSPSLSDSSLHFPFPPQSKNRCPH